MSAPEASTSAIGPKPQQNADAAAAFEINDQPVCLIVLGMAGSGKTTFVKKLCQFSDLKNMKPYVVNLDPACKEVPYHANVGKWASLVG